MESEIAMEAARKLQNAGILNSHVDSESQDLAAVAFLISSVYDPYIHDNVVATQSAFDAGLEAGAKIVTDARFQGHVDLRSLAAAIRSRIGSQEDQ